MQKNVLLIEDDGELQTLISFILEAAGFKVAVAGTAGEAWIHAAEVKYDAFILDLMLPDLDGISFCELLRKLPRTSNACILMLTAWASPQAELLGKQAGADAYLTKPFHPIQLVEQLNLHLNHQGFARPGVLRRPD